MQKETLLTPPLVDPPTEEPHLAPPPPNATHSAPPADRTSQDTILPRLIPQPLHLSQVYLVNDGSSLSEGKSLMSRLDSSAPIRILHGQVLRKLAEYNEIRNAHSDFEVLPALDVRLGASGSGEGLVNSGQFSRGVISRIGEGTERDTIQVNVWFDLDQIKEHSQANIDTALMNELSNINLFLGVLNAGLKTNSDEQVVPATFEEAWAAAQNTTSHPFFESGTYAIDIGLAGIHQGSYNDLLELRQLLAEQTDLEKFVTTFNNAVARATPSYVRGFEPFIRGESDSILRYRSGTLESVQPPSESPAKSDEIYISPSRAVFLNSSMQRMLDQIKLHLELYGAPKGVELTTQRVNVPKMGEVVVPALRLSEEIAPE